MRKDQGKVPAFLRQERDGGLDSRPKRIHMGLEPAPQLEAVELSLIQQESQQVFSIHITIPKWKRRSGGLGGGLRTPQVEAQCGLKGPLRINNVKQARVPFWECESFAYARLCTNWFEPRPEPFT
jgi:hypothetical protein